MAAVQIQGEVFNVARGSGPIIAAAIHAGHEVRPEVLTLLGLDDAQRLREEDPFTDAWVACGDTRIIGLRSRFEVDLNRPPEKAIYVDPQDAWGLNVWKAPLPPSVKDASLAHHAAFYSAMEGLLEQELASMESLVVFDLHSYNHRRDGPSAPPAPPESNPEVNLGTGPVHSKWRPIIDLFMETVRARDFMGRSLDVRENVKFQGGFFNQWISKRYGDRVCVLSIEFKKFFMDEWTGEPDWPQIDAIRQALTAAAGKVREQLVDP